MKKLVCLLVFVVVAFPVVSQDTLVSKVPPSSYYYTQWIDTSGTGYLTSFAGSNDIPLVGCGFYSSLNDLKDSLTIFGIAVAIDARGGLDETSCIWLDLHKVQPGGLAPLSDTLSIYPGRDAPSYWFQIDMLAHPPYLTPLPIKPVYEAYFDEPVKVTDSFYVCVIDSLSAVRARENVSWPIGVVVYRSTSGSEDFKYVIENIRPDGHVIYEFKKLLYLGLAYLFPIIDSVRTTSNSDTVPSNQGGDSVGIGHSPLLERCVLVSPNPAREQARVTSSIGMTSVELYSVTGTKMASYSAEGMTTVLDLASYPDGTYLLRVHTPMGVAVKKLVVQRK